MISLGFESTAHTAAVSIVTDKKEILSDIKDMYITKEGGIIPIEAAQHHKTVFRDLVKKAFEESKVKKPDIVSVAAGPGLPPCLLEGMKIAKELSRKFNVPLISVNHLIAHLESGKLFTKSKDPVFVLATGANTQIIFYEGKRYHIGGESLDTGMGNALDKFGRAINLGFPAGPKIEKIAKNGSYIELPYVVKGMDLSFSGILTKAINLYENKKASKQDLCFSLQETYFSMLTEVTERAIAHTNKKEALLIGGVAANKRLIEMLDMMCKERNCKFYYVPLKYSGDNAAQIAWTGMLQYNSNKKYYDNLDLSSIDIKPSWRTEEVNVTWLN